MARKLLFLSIAACLLIGAAQGAFAHDHFYSWDGHWQRYAPGTTTQAWEFGGLPGPNTHNPYGTAQLSINGGDISPTGLLIGPNGGSVGIHIPNNSVNNPFKLIYIQVTADKALNGAPIVAAPGTITTTPGPTIYNENPPSAFYTYSWITKIERNPFFEDITLNFYGDTNVEEIVIDTICVPEPSSMAALVTSGLFAGVFALRRRRL
ncbi:MAG: PEP-CTERM sorting domain-containing protein [Armatimonadota bacterium]